MSSCWSCLVIIDQGVKVCPFCGADQTAPRPVVLIGASEPPNKTLVLLRWAAAAIAVAACLGGLLWYARWERKVAPVLRAEAAATDSLRDLRLVLSEYAMASHDAYPASLESLDDRARLLALNAHKEGYELVYTAHTSRGDALIHSFVLLARPGKSNLRNFYIDESGVLRATQEDRPANGQDPPI
jgi:hypothetical protein